MKPAYMNLLLAMFLFSPALHASDAVPDCLDNDGSSIPIINSQVLTWEKSTPNQYLARAHVSGKIVKLLPNQPKHNHFEIQIGDNSDDRLEVIYDYAFGQLPQLEVGMDVEACGDYITSTAQSGPYKPSPVGAIIHWIHKSDEPNKHPDGFTVINGEVCGQDLPSKHEFRFVP